MKFLIVGLGNPGAEYADTRHNAGFLVLDRIAKEKGAVFTPDRFGHTCKITHRGRTLILLKPDTFMNLSGKAVRFHREKDNLKNENILVVTDDLALPLGKIRMRARGSAGGHNGLKSINEILAKEDYPRLRFGIGKEFSTGEQVDYVLSEFSSEEKKALETLLEKAVKMVLSFTFAGINQTMSEFND